MERTPTSQAATECARRVCLSCPDQARQHAAGKNAGFQKADVILQIASQFKRMTERELIGQLLQNQQAGEKVKATVLRGSERVELSLPMQ
jgi:hypothetical protein